MQLVGQAYSTTRSSGKNTQPAPCRQQVRGLLLWPGLRGNWRCTRSLWPTRREALLLYELVQLGPHILKRVPVALGPPACQVSDNEHAVSSYAGSVENWQSI